MNSSAIKIKKFLFDVSFDPPGEHHVVAKSSETEKTIQEIEAQARDEIIEPLLNEEMQEEKIIIPTTFTQEELDEATKTSFALGEASGVKKHSQNAASLQSKAFEQIADTIKKVSVEQKQNQDTILKNAILLATMIVKKAIPNIIKKYEMTEIEALMEKHLPQVTNQEKIMIKVNPEQKHAVDMKISELARSFNFDSQINVVEDPSILLGDCKISWDNGGVERNMEKFIKDLDNIINQNISVKEKA